MELFLDEVDPIVLIWLNERVFFPSSTKITYESDISIYILNMTYCGNPKFQNWLQLSQLAKYAVTQYMFTCACEGLYRLDGFGDNLIDIFIDTDCLVL